MWEPSWAASLIPCSRQMSVTLVPLSACRDARDLLLRMSLFRHLRTSSIASREPRLPRLTYLSVAAFRFSVTRLADRPTSFASTASTIARSAVSLSWEGGRPDCEDFGDRNRAGVAGI